MRRTLLTTPALLVALLAAGCAAGSDEDSAAAPLADQPQAGVAAPAAPERLAATGGASTTAATAVQPVDLPRALDRRAELVVAVDGDLRAAADAAAQRARTAGGSLTAESTGDEQAVLELRVPPDRLEEALAATGVAAAQVNDLAGLVKHPQLHERDRWREVGTETGPVHALLPPMNFRDVELPMGDVPALGQHTTDVLERLGRSSEGIAALRERRTIQ